MLIIKPKKLFWGLIGIFALFLLPFYSQAAPPQYATTTVTYNAGSDDYTVTVEIDGIFSNQKYQVGITDITGIETWPDITSSIICPSSFGGFGTSGDFSVTGTGQSGILDWHVSGSPDCSVAGTYYMLFGEQTNSPDFTPMYYGAYNYNPAATSTNEAFTEIVPPPATTSPQILDQTSETRFTDVSVSGSSSTVTFDIDYILNTAEYTADTRPDIININVLAQGFFNDQQVDNQKRLILPLADGAHNKIITSDHLYTDGDYIAFINFFNLNTNRLTFTTTNIHVEFELSGGVVVGFTILEITDGLVLPDELKYQDCSITNLSGCFINALIFTFVPDEESLNKFTGLYTKIETKPPFGYVTSVKNALAGLGASTTAAFDFGNIPFQSAIFDQFKAILIIGLWVLYALFFMGRLNKLDI